MIGNCRLFQKVRWSAFLEYHARLSKKTRSLQDIPQHLKSLKRHQSYYLKKFKELATGIPNVNPRNYVDDDDWWALGRHHGLMTPLLDWTYSPFVAAYFAYIDCVNQLNPGFLDGGMELFTRLGGANNEYISVWSLSYDSRLNKLSEFRIMTRCSVGSYRQRAQQGVFTHLSSDEHLDLESYFKKHKLSELLECFFIPTNQYSKALHALDLMNINHMTLFPDLQGAAVRANISQVMAQLHAL